VDRPRPPTFDNLVDEPHLARLPESGNQAGAPRVSRRGDRSVGEQSLKRRTKSADLRDLATERTNTASVDLDRKTSLEIARIINREDAKVAAAVKRVLPQVAEAIDLVAAALANGGRLIYVGTGTSGRIAALDAAECPPTFDTDPSLVQFLIAGGPKALGTAVEADEDSRTLGRKDMAKRAPRKNDVVVGVAASGRTPFTVAALRYARSHGAKTVAVTCNRNSQLEQVANVAIVAEVGPEVLAGSTRMKAGTAEKMILNMLTTGAMTRLGYVYGNLMVNLHVKNEKLTERAIGIVQQTVAVNREKARKLLAASGNRVPVALVMAKAKVNRAQAEAALKESRGQVRKAIALAKPA
jgi:N-acetylmuramic acid 6-phosphate etherase